jgi:hypothetical protein
MSSRTACHSGTAPSSARIAARSWSYSAAAASGSTNTRRCSGGRPPRAAPSAVALRTLAFASHSSSVSGVAALTTSRALVQGSEPESKAWRVCGSRSDSVEIPISSHTLLLPIRCSPHA